MPIDKDPTFDVLRPGQAPNQIEEPEFDFDPDELGEGDGPEDTEDGGLPGAGDDGGVAGGGGLEPPQPDAQEEQRLSRRDRRIQSQQEALIQERTRAAEMERQLNEMRQREAQVQQQQQQYNEQQYLESLPWEQRQAYELDKMRKENARQIQQLQFQNTCQNDKIQFDMQAQSNPTMRRLAATVEQVFNDQLRQGRFYPRAQVFTYALGLEIQAKEQMEHQKRTRTVQHTGVPGQRVAAPNSRSNQTARPRGGNRPLNELTLQEREDRLSNIKF